MEVTADQINAVFQGGAGIMVLLHVRQAYIDKDVKGVSLVSVLFFVLWGAWNCYYLPYLQQWWSFAAGFVALAANTVWLLQLWHYKRRRRNG